ncbi:MAG: hypothetical protein OXU26_12155 [Acidobacteriota bacterium]|nr:hypothetical protein [Acidobacteriota bacterium]MDE2964659.1 hypothetical protein [Acidobacteriota bacterium]
MKAMATTCGAPPPSRRRHPVSEGRSPRRWFRSLPVCLVILSLAMPVLARDTKLERQYQGQQGKLRRQGNTVKKVKILIRMSAIDLEIVSRRVRSGLFSDADRILERYAGAVGRAEQVLKDSKRDPQRKPGGFKHLEISLRKQLRQLADLRDRYPFDRQQVIDRTIACAEAVKQRMIAALFGPDNTGRSNGGSAGSGQTGTAEDPSPCGVK